MNKSKAERVTDAELVEALEAGGGIIAAAISYIGEHFHKTVCRATVSERIRKSDTVRAARDEGLEDSRDLAESKLFEAIKAGNLTAVIFFLKTRGKDRGYTERQEIHTREEAAVSVINPYEGMSKEELRALVQNGTPRERKEHRRGGG